MPNFIRGVSSAVSSPGSNKRKKLRPWPAVLLTSCLTAAPGQSYTGLLHTNDTDSTRRSHDPAPINARRQALNAMPVAELLSHFFSLKGLVSPAMAQTPPPGGGNDITPEECQRRLEQHGQEYCDSLGHPTDVNGNPLIRGQCDLIDHPPYAFRCHSVLREVHYEFHWDPAINPRSSGTSADTFCWLDNSTNADLMCDDSQQRTLPSAQASCYVVNTVNWDSQYCDHGDQDPDDPLTFLCTSFYSTNMGHHGAGWLRNTASQVDAIMGSIPIDCNLLRPSGYQDDDDDYGYYYGCDGGGGPPDNSADPPPDGGRFLDLTPKPAMMIDKRYRDMCVDTARLDKNKFDQKSGKVLAPDIQPDWAVRDLIRLRNRTHCAQDSTGEEYCYVDPDYYEYDEEDYYGYYPEALPDSMSAFDQPFVGKVSGSKPPYGACMPILDTPKVEVRNFELSDQPNLAFTYFLNMDDRSFNIPPKDADPYGSSNYYRDLTFFTGGVLGCPDILSTTQAVSTPGHPELGEHGFPTNRANLQKLTRFWRFKADNCYNYYILNHSDYPWFTLERPAAGSDDPLSMYDPDRAYLNSCQPLIAGKRSEEILHSTWEDMPREKKFASHMEKKSGYAPVLQYEHRADLDEAEYLLSTYLQKAWDENFVDITNHKDNPGSYVIKPGSAIPKHFRPIGLPCVQLVDSSIPPDSGHVFPQPAPGSTTGSPPQCVPDAPAPAPESMGPGCHTIIFPVPDDLDYVSPGKVDPYYCPNIEKITEPSHPFSPRNDMIGMTDRDYSAFTSKRHIRACDREADGYTDWLIRDQVDRILHPVVQCAVVPVDILGFRAAAFDNCIMQRINTNFNQWVHDGMPEWGYDWTPPCATRYWESDNYSGDHACPVRMSIQQCCRIIVKDVVPANFLKLRTCEGLLQKRREDRVMQEKLQGMPVGPDTGPTGAGGLDDAYADDREEWWEHSIAYLNDEDPDFATFSNSPDAERFASRELNRQHCDDTEPLEYRFGTYFGKFYINVPNNRDPDWPRDNEIPSFVGVHMPYMRWWDTGVSAGNSHHGGSFINTLGGFDVLLGVGREERDKYDAKQTYRLDKMHNAPQERTERIKHPQRSEMGRIGGWAEFKAHEMWTIRRSNLFCVGRYEKLFKQGGPENFVLAKAGAGYTSVDSKQWPWPMGWRGYAGDTHGREFPDAFSSRSSVPGPNSPNIFGLDNALPGDIISYTINDMPQLAYVTDIGGYALPGSDVPIGVDTQGYFDFNQNKYRKGDPLHPRSRDPILHPTRIFVVSWDQGKFPTSAGSSVLWGQGPEHTIYKFKVPKTYREEICAKNLRALTDADGSGACRQAVDDNGLTPDACNTQECQPSCLDSDYSACVLDGGKAEWNAAKIYRPYKDVRQCNGHIETIPSITASYNWGRTYSWTGISNNPASPPLPPDPNVLYQSLTQTVYTNLFSWCVNSGFDAPPHYNKEYRGPQTGALTDTTLCGPTWHYPSRDRNAPTTGCSTALPEGTKFFPQTN